MMYRMVAVHPSDRHHLTIAWESKQYQMNRLPFGLKPAGYLAGRCLVELSNLYRHEYPEASNAVLKNRYADDFCIGADTIEEAIHLRNQLTTLLSKGEFEILKWSSNVSDVLLNISESFKKTPVTLPAGETGVKVLGVFWDQNHDEFVARIIKFDSPIVTRRTVLSYIAKIYDVMGLFSPTIFIAKNFMQCLWLYENEWDSLLQEDLRVEWINFADDLLKLSNIKIPRFVPLKGSKVRLVGFTDGSEKGMAAALYVYLCDENCSTFLLKAKSKLTPLKTLTIPRLELCAALLLANLLRSIIDTTDIHYESINLYTDSKIVLAWLDHPLHELKIFVANRVVQIRASTSNALWGHVNGTENPADLGSRGISADKLKESNLWGYGPKLLSLPFEEWPRKLPEVLAHDQIPETKTSLMLNTVDCEPKDQIIRRFSSLSRMQRVLAFMKRFADNLRKSASGLPKISGPLSVSELDTALLTAVRLNQHEEFEKDIRGIKEGKLTNNQLLKLSPFFDEKTQGVRVGGRLRMAYFLPEDTRHPFLLSKKSHLSTLISDYYHKLLLHSGPRTTCSNIQKKFWILSIMSLVKQRIHRCVICQNRKKYFRPPPQLGTCWVLNVPYGQNFNGCAENGIKSAKSLLRRQIGDQILTFEEFGTLLCRVERVLNSRPISFARNDINDQNIHFLTPGHFITGHDLMTPPEEILDKNATLRDRWRRVQQMSQLLWRTWSTAYLHELMQRSKWTKPTENLKIGTLVYVTDLRTSPLFWPIGRIEETLPSKSDSTVRVVRVRVHEHDLLRPVNKLIVIPTEQ